MNPLSSSYQTNTAATLSWHRDRETTSRVNPLLSAVDEQQASVGSALIAPVFVGAPCSNGLFVANPADGTSANAKNSKHAADAQRGSP